MSETKETAILRPPIEPLPEKITTQEENERWLPAVERLMDIGDQNRTPEEDDYLERLVQMIVDTLHLNRNDYRWRF